MVSSGPHAGRHGAEVPPEVVEAAKRAMATRDSSAELMELVRDSVDDGATGDVRTLVFSGAGTTM
ncbi:MAG: hypothetical protein JWN17_1822, partial [Frankiales bacterium]|nr:hypothetical protein [Frankiales bacterium]